jgi:hypothetical protein
MLPLASGLSCGSLSIKDVHPCKTKAAITAPQMKPRNSLFISPPLLIFVCGKITCPGKKRLFEKEKHKRKTA